MGEFPGGPVVRTRRFPCRGPGSVPGPETKIPQALRRGQKNPPKKQKAKQKKKAYQWLPGAGGWGDWK